jgi:pyrroloquinoline quinone (PQQ) biosynthesis protein C
MERLSVLRQLVAHELQDTRLFKALFTNALDQAAYIRYLQNAYYYARHSPKIMALAASRCMDSHPELAAYLLHHAEEERGHDLWALEDLRDFHIDEAQARSALPVPACAAMVGYIHYVAGFSNPIGVFGWMYILEAVGHDLGSRVASRLKASFGGSGASVRFVARHGDTDVRHADELAQEIRTHVRHDHDLAEVTHVAEVVADLYPRMFREVGGEEPRWA